MPGLVVATVGKLTGTEMSMGNASGLQMAMAGVVGLVAGLVGALAIAPLFVPVVDHNPASAGRTAETGSAHDAQLVEVLGRLEHTMAGLPAASSSSGSPQPGPLNAAQLDALLTRLDQVVAALEANVASGSNVRPSEIRPTIPPGASAPTSSSSSGSADSSGPPRGEGMAIPLPDRSATLDTSFDDIALEEAWRMIRMPDATLADVSSSLFSLYQRINDGGDARAWLLLRLAARHTDPQIAALAIDQMYQAGRPPPPDEVGQLLGSTEPAVLSMTYKLIGQLGRPVLVRLLVQHSPPAGLAVQYGDAIAECQWYAENHDGWSDALVAQLRLRAQQYPPSEDRSGD